MLDQAQVSAKVLLIKNVIKSKVKTQVHFYGPLKMSIIIPLWIHVLFWYVQKKGNTLVGQFYGPPINFFERFLLKAHDGFATLRWKVL